MDDSSSSPRVAAVQIDSRAGDMKRNLDKILLALTEAARLGVQLAVFPEVTIHGYGYSDPTAVESDAISTTDSVFKNLCAEISGLGLYAVIGFIERDEDKLFNSSALIGPDGQTIGKHRKIHSPFLGVDRYVDRGNEEPKVYDTPIGRIGLLICADMVFPEASRICALKGADIIAISACVPDPLHIYSNSLVQVRGYENCVYVIYSNMTGGDGDWRYVGRSQIVDPGGKILAEASTIGVETLVADIDLTLAREKLRIRPAVGGIPHAYEFDFARERRPELYRSISSPDTKWCENSP